MKTNCAVYLLAGRGSRLGLKTEDKPKCLIEIAGQSLLERSVQQLSKLNVNRFIFVVGYKSENIREVFGESWHHLRIEYVYNNDWETTNNVVSLAMAVPVLQSDFYLLEGDLIYAGSEIEKMSKTKNSIALAPFENFMNGTVVSLLDHYRVDRFFMQHKDDLKNVFKTVNIYHFDHQDFMKVVVPEIEGLLSSGEKQCYYEQAIAYAVQKRLIDLKGVIFDQHKWYEIDTETDLRIARKLFE